MAKIITYSLKNSSESSDQFYADLTRFTDQILQEAETRLGMILDSFLLWVRESEAEPERTRQEYIFDLLVLGVLWRVNAVQGSGTARWVQGVLAWLVKIREKSAFLKPLADGMRGLWGGVFMPRQGVEPESIPVNANQLESLINWLKAAGDFSEEIRRIELWREFLSSNQNLVIYLDKIIYFAKYFDKSSMDALGRYTPNVEYFLAYSHPAYRWREDFIFTGRQRIEYHLYMVGMEIMNRSFRELFLKTEQKILFVPPCMAAPQDGTCQAKDTLYGERCAHCTPSCQVNQITRYGEKHGIQVFMIPDSFSPLSAGDSAGLKETSLGVMGVSCPLTITSGGFEMRRVGIPAQGVLLDHCGCSWHWDLDKGIVTEINFRQLIRALNEEK